VGRPVTEKTTARALGRRGSGVPMLPGSSEDDDEVRWTKTWWMASTARATVASDGYSGRPEVVMPGLLRRAIVAAWRPFSVGGMGQTDDGSEGVL
jgi:hypothetical protein